MRNVPGRKTDVADACWGAQLLEHGLVRPSFIPPRPTREQRDLTRYRKAVVEERGREVQRLHKVLEDAGVKLSSVASSVLTMSGRAMIDALMAGQRDPAALAELAKGKMRAKIARLEGALAGRFNEHHALLCRAMLARIDQADATIAELTGRIEALQGPHEAAVTLLVGIPGVSTRTAQVVLAEIGTDMSRFPTAGHLASWAGMCPGNNESAGRHRSGKTRYGRSGCASPWSKPPRPPGVPRAPTSAPSTPASAPGAGLPVPRSPSGTPSWSSPGTCFRPVSPTTTSEATTSTSAAPATLISVDLSQAGGGGPQGHARARSLITPFGASPRLRYSAAPVW
jgi:hypothetical protein